MRLRQAKWVQQPVEPTLFKEASGQSTRGIAYWHKGSQERLISVRGEYLYALDRSEDRQIGQTLVKTAGLLSEPSKPPMTRILRLPRPFHRERRDRQSAAMAAANERRLRRRRHGCKASPRDIRGYDIHTGKLIWTFQSLPQKASQARHVGQRLGRIRWQHGGLGS